MESRSIDDQFKKEIPAISRIVQIQPMCTECNLLCLLKSIYLRYGFILISFYRLSSMSIRWIETYPKPAIKNYFQNETDECQVDKVTILWTIDWYVLRFFVRVVNENQWKQEKTEIWREEDQRSASSFKT